ncbi:MAG: SDR family NAD(P)-dependent oxidoreductase [Balneolaceae bacterium]
MSKNIIIIGATSGIGEGIARECIKKNYKVGVTGRRVKRLHALKEKLGNNIFPHRMDVIRHKESRESLLKLIEEMGGMDIIVLNAGISNFHGSDQLSVEQKVINVNVSGFVQLFKEAYDYFENQGHGHIVGISSVASLFGYGRSAVYNASKSFISLYMQGYRQKAKRSPSDITITDIRPGFVESEMTEGNEKLFWMASTKKASQQILNAIEKKRNIVYITRRWRLFAWLVKIIPDFVWNRL